MRISGPLVSSIRLTRSPPGALRMLPTRRWNSSDVACEKLQRITEKPAATHFSSVSYSSEAGPMVATTLVSGSVVSMAMAETREGAALIDIDEPRVRADAPESMAAKAAALYSIL